MADSNGIFVGEAVKGTMKATADMPQSEDAKERREGKEAIEKERENDSGSEGGEREVEREKTSGSKRERTRKKERKRERVTQRERGG